MSQLVFTIIQSPIFFIKSSNIQLLRVRTSIWCLSILLKNFNVRTSGITFFEKKNSRLFLRRVGLKFSDVFSKTLTNVLSKFTVGGLGSCTLK